MKTINKKGFTLIELLVVIAIIGLLSTMAVVALNNARTKSRDAKRVSDIKQIQTALEMYFTDQNNYPAAGTSDDALALLQTSGFFAALPTNPTPNGHAYKYAVCSSNGATCGDDGDVAEGNRASYTLTYELEGGVSPMTAGNHCATPGGIDAGNAAGANCYVANGADPVTQAGAY
jgi:prepilin-type N-terminal cleavage/methylation domain-containing protein